MTKSNLDKTKNLTRIYHSTKFDVSFFKNLSLYQSRALIYLLNYFSHYVIDRINGVGQLYLFDNINESKYCEIPIFLSDIVPRIQQDALIAEIQKMKQIECNFDIKRNNEDHETSTLLVTGVSKPKKLKRKNVIYIDVNVNLFRSIVETISNKGKVIFNSHYFEISMTTTKLYLPRIYILLSSFEEQGHYRKSYFEFLNLIGIDKDSPDFNSRYLSPSYFEDKILRPIQKDLYDSANFFFSYTINEYKNKQNEYYIHFIINNDDTRKAIGSQIKQIESLLLNRNYSDVFSKNKAAILSCPSLDKLQQLKADLASLFMSKSTITSDSINVLIDKALKAKLL